MSVNVQHAAHISMNYAGQQYDHSQHQQQIHFTE